MSVDLFNALTLATETHINKYKQCAKPVPFIIHPISVANYLRKVTANESIIIVGLLHHVIEDDEKYDRAYIANNYSEFIAEVLFELKVDRKLSKADSKRTQILQAKEIGELARLKKPIQFSAALVKLADKIDNLYSFSKYKPNWSEEICTGYILWCFAICKELKNINSYFDSLINEFFGRIGIYNVTDEQLEYYYSLL